MTEFKRPAPLLIFTHAQKAAAAKREAGYRRHVYARRVAEGKMTQTEADRGVAVMEAIAADYEPKIEQGSLPI
jgi:hypothetical protein